MKKLELLKIEKLLMIYVIIMTFFDVHSTLLVFDKHGIYNENFTEANLAFWLFLGTSNSMYISLFFTGLFNFLIWFITILAGRLVTHDLVRRVYYGLLVCLQPFALINNYSIWFFDPLPIKFLLGVNVILLGSLILTFSIAFTALFTAATKEEKSKLLSRVESLDTYRAHKKKDFYVFSGTMLILGFIVSIFYFVILETTTTIFYIWLVLIVIILWQLSMFMYDYRFRIEKMYQKARKRAGLM